MGEHITRAAWLARRKSPVTLDHGVLSPSGRVSAPARRAALARVDATLEARRVAEAEYQRLVDAGEIVDPSGEIRRSRPGLSPRRAQLARQIADLEHFVAVGFRPRAHARDLARARAELAALPPEAP